MIKKFIDRPVLSTVISIIIVILGILGLTTLPVTQYPDIAPATVMVRANYPGANAQTVMESVVIPLEEQINGVEGMTYITSNATNTGSAQIEIFFEQGVNPDIAGVNVQNRVARAMPLLPSEVTRSGVVTQKQQRSALMYLSFFSTNKGYDDVFLQNFININFIPQLKRINGVGEASVFGGKSYAMRIWLDPAKLAAYKLAPSEVISAINQQSQEASAGAVGQNSGNSFEYIIKYKGKLRDESEYKNIIIKSLNQGQYLRLSDVATVKLDALVYDGKGEFNGNPAVSLGIFQTPGSNAQVIIKNIKKFLAENKKNMPDGIDYMINFDTNEFLDASIDKVVTTLLEAFLLVFLVVFIFLQDLRSTIIPAVAVPVSIIGTFFFLNLLGFSLNLLTLFALVLAIGIVVDDAIVVVEAVHAKLDRGEKNPRRATVNAMSEITGAIVSITIVMAAVFLPVTFIGGPTGVFYKQFGITLIIAILISAVNALTLSPALCALFLKPHMAEEHQRKNLLQRFFFAFNAAFRAFTMRYGRAFLYLIRHKWVTLAILVVSVGLIYWANHTMPSGFVPNEDRGLIFGNAELPPGASMERTYDAMKALEKKATSIPGVKTMTFTTGRSIISGSGSNYGFALIRLNSFADRKGHSDQTVDAIKKKLFGLSAGIPEGKFIFFEPGSVPGFSSSAGFDFILLDKAGGELNELDKTTRQLIANLSERPEIQYVQTSFNTNYPQYQMNVDIEKASAAGVTVDDILATVQAYVGGIYAADFTKYGKQFRVMVQALPSARADIQHLNSLYVKNKEGMMAPLTQFVNFEKTYGPQSINRFNLFSSVNISGAPNPGYSTGDAIEAIREVSGTTLSPSYGIDFSGLTREEINSSNQTAIIFLLSLLFVYFILAAQYESYVLPLAVITSLPVGVMGAYIGQKLFGLENNIYFQIALIMLVGLLAKNAILIVEFALQRRRHGESLTMSAINAAKARLRPILMTSFAFIVGMMPLVFSSGVGAVGNKSIATGAASGLLIGTLLGLIVIPVLYVIFQWLQEKIRPLKSNKLSEYEEAI
ncbi:MAG TPA: efflux RND transporter permease subunit [Saprospiraceae bacterium]|nr:efflux RND transporter permease subunit [Saprospiraceae bacterium]